MKWKFLCHLCEDKICFSPLPCSVVLTFQPFMMLIVESHITVVLKIFKTVTNIHTLEQQPLRFLFLCPSLLEEVALIHFGFTFTYIHWMLYRCIHAQQVYSKSSHQKRGQTTEVKFLFVQVDTLYLDWPVIVPVRVLFIVKMLLSGSQVELASLICDFNTLLRVNQTRDCPWILPWGF